ncbi:hypothetical protein RA307_25435 [Xanthobacteraceae bacterium Astr-EGSB]|uniref:hypothetical protein n=1 Tax=Astrobacterium formosum TaxID=3069710 RepID=UPI0027AF4C6B|nr:hypothetical protein [Xanthobacteraceae bacterium Astr-EGSB]
MRKTTVKANVEGGFMVGRARFAKISAVEGVKLTPSMNKRAVEFDRAGLSAEERRKAIIRAHAKA